MTRAAALTVLVLNLAIIGLNWRSGREEPEGPVYWPTAAQSAATERLAVFVLCDSKRRVGSGLPDQPAAHGARGQQLPQSERATRVAHCESSLLFDVTVTRSDTKYTE